MIIIEAPIQRGFCFKPFIVLPQWLNNCGPYQKRLYLAHETCHYGSQRYFPFIWLIRYFTSRKFRLAKEVDAYAFELLVQAANLGVPTDNLLNQYASIMAAHYWGMGTYETIKQILKEKVKEVSENEEVKRLLDEEKVRYNMVYSNQRA